MKKTNKPSVIMDEFEIESTLDQFATQILKENPNVDNLAIIGIQTGGAYLGKRLLKKLEHIAKIEIPLGLLDITLYRDDLELEKEQPLVKETNIPFKINGRTIILVDDVLYTGRTVRAALDALIDFGRPNAIHLAVLIDRGLREIPIRPDYCGKTIKTTHQQKVHVFLREKDAVKDQVIIEMEVKPCH